MCSRKFYSPDGSKIFRQDSRLPSRVVFDFLEAKLLGNNENPFKSWTQSAQALCSRAQKKRPKPFFNLCACQDLNLGPNEYQSFALPTELHARICH